MKIICIGRNYHKHIQELNNKVPSDPVFFMKPDSAILPKKNPLFYPEFTKDLQYEVELIIRINKLGKNIQPRFAPKYFNEIGLGIDFTARDVQQNCKENGLPWEIAKAFDGSAVIGNFMKIDEIDDINNLNFSLKKNEKPVQVGNTKNMIFSFNHIIAYLSQFMTLKIGDLIFTGTPEGVGPVEINDHLKGFIENREMLSLKIR